jgi:lipoprotein NlpI
MKRTAMLLVLILATSGFAQTPNELLKSAVEAMGKKQYDQALKYANMAVAADPKSIQALSVRSGILESLEKYDAAAADCTRILALEEKAGIYQQRGVLHFKAGKIKESIADYDKYIELKPQAKISHWQRGIAYYYAGQFDDGKKQFEGYQDFDSNDVENAVWRFMCMVRSVGIEKARKDMLKIGNDRRVPMRQVYDLYKGDLKPEDVFTAVKAGEPNAEQLNSRLFYAHLYVGIYHDLLGDKKKALAHLNEATEHRIGHYMWDVARVHRDLLRKETDAKK